VYQQLEEYGKRLEHHFKDVQNMQFIIEDGKLWMLYAKNAKLGAAAEVKTSVDLVHEGIITRQEAITNVYAPLLKYLHHQVLDPKTRGEHKSKLLGTGFSGSKVSATGHALFDIAKVQEWSAQGKNIVLFLTDNTADNYISLVKVQGYVTSRGGPVCDASILTRDRAIAGVMSCTNLVISDT
jgi:pyruvate,orthophosphate dikinase